MSHRRRAQLGLVSAIGILALTVSVLFVGAKTGLEQHGRVKSSPVIQPHVGDVSLANASK
ncbi:MAG TPA: hypothetical protein VEA69_22520 [Tepidisphaeraceae bacterium]|nr:hypothetical protein [Tepidisphaeraceae bacterium]